MRKALGALLALVVGAVVFVVVREINHAATGPGEINVADQVQQGLKLAAARIRPTLPKKVDDATTLTEVANAGMVLTYHYVVDRENYELLPNFMQTAQRITTGLLCNTEDTKGAMTAGAAYEYQYSDTTSQSLGGFVVTSADCK